ncbi:MAG: DNA/RNA non-specific endonuclease [Bacteroidaceae bacterium]|nr:DNA/RNA non-specific endonuclease [Bacteroidaceae bacterium]
MEQNQKRKSGKYYLALCLALIIFLFVIAGLWNLAFGQTTNTYTKKKAKPRYELARTPKSPSTKLLQKEGFFVSYNTTTLCPNYVAWELTSSESKGKIAERTNWFEEDNTLSEDVQVKYSDYSNSRYDRGHMCPSGDNKYSQKAMEDCFLMTNICPQAKNLNKGAWNDLEMQCRYWAKKYGSVYIACGPIFDSDHPKKIGKRRKISVPDRFFKVVMTYGKESKAIGFIFPNDDVYDSWKNYVVSVDEIEHITGFDFFYQLNDLLEERIESKKTLNGWSVSANF